MPLLKPDDEIALPGAPAQSWQDVVDALVRLAKLVTPKARVHAYWNVQPTLGASLQQMKSKLDDGNVNGILMGVNAAIPTPAERQKVGGSGIGCQFDWDLKIEWWVFRGYEKGTDVSNVFRSLYADCRDYTVIIQKNQLDLGMMAGHSLKAGVLGYESIDLHGFPDGDTIIAQGAITITLREQL